MTYVRTPLIKLLPKTVYINPVKGTHYHIKGCQMIDSSDYIEIDTISILGKRYSDKKYRRCGCIDMYLHDKMLSSQNNSNNIQEIK